MEQITPEQAVTNAIIACRVEALRARARGTHTIADEWEGHASTIRNLEAKLAEAEKRKVPEGWEYRHLSRVGRPDISISYEFMPIPSEHDRLRWFWQIANTGAYGSCETAQDAIRAAEAAAEEADHAER